MKHNAVPNQINKDNRNLHLTHIEDEILEFSYEGAKTALAFIEAVAGMLAGHSELKVNVTEKWDGSPAIVVGTNPENGKFFVSTKSIFNHRPKINYTTDDVLKHHGNGELSQKLIIALTELKQLNIRGILQGDMMFTHDDLEVRNIEGVDYVVFTPNTITYAVPKDSALANKIFNSKLGIIFHTSYTGKSLDTLKASYIVDLSSLTPSSTVWYDDATYIDESGTVTLTENETDFVFQHLCAAEMIFEELQEVDLDAMIKHPELIDIIKIYTNNCIRQGIMISASDHWLDGLMNFIHERIENKKHTLKTTEAKQRWDSKKQHLHNFIDSERKTIKQVLSFQSHIVTAKEVLLEKLKAIRAVNTFLETETGFQVTTPEGFVVVDHMADRAVKLVDRLEFSRANFQRNKR